MDTRRQVVCRAFALFMVLFSATAGWAAADLGQAWNRRYDQQTFLGAHNAYATTGSGYRKLNANQLGTIKDQLDGGVRCLSLDIFLMREKEQDALMKFEKYEDRDAFRTPSPGFTNILPGIVLAHNPARWGYSLFDDYLIFNHGFENIFTVLTAIEAWMGENLNEVVTVVFESSVAEPGILFQYFGDAELFNMIFFADRPNPRFPGPDGKAWNVPVHGWPRLSDIVSAGKRLVVFSGNGVKWNRYSGEPINGASTTDDDGMPFQWNFMTENGYGTDGIQGEVDDARGESNPLDDMLFPLTWMNWFPEANVVGPDHGGGSDPDQYTWDYGNLNSYKVLSSARDQFAAAAQRYPNFISVDFYHKGGDAGPRRLVRECNTYWANRPVVTASLTITPAPNIFGWRRSAEVIARGAVPDGSMSVRWINYYWHGGHDILGHAEETASVLTYPVWINLRNGTNNPNLGTPTDGIFRVSAEAVTTQGDRSDRAVKWVRVDNTPPIVRSRVSRPPDGTDGTNAWYNRPVHIHVTVADLLSGPRHVWWTDRLGQTNFSEVYFSSVTNDFIERTFDFFYEEEGHAFLRFTGEDYAGNTNPTNSGFILIKMDRTPPVTSVAAISNGVLNTTVVLSAYETLSGTNGTWYQLDDDTNWIAYTAPLVMSRAQPHTLRFYSRDVAGNSESVRTFRIGQTAISLSAERNPAGYYQALEIVATVTGPTPRPSGTVTFRDGTNVMGTVTLDTNGIARLRLTPFNYTLARGSHQLTAEFNGNANYAPAVSPVLAQEVVDPPSVTFTVSATSALQTQPVVFNATVSSGDARIPTGTILFRALNGVSGREVLSATVPLDTNGHASFVTDDLPFAYLLLLADYSGDADFPPNSFGGVRELFILPAQTEVTVTTTPNPSRLGEPVKFTIAATSTEGATQPVNGSIRIDESDEEFETLPLDNTNVVTYVTSSLAPGNHSFLITANTVPHLSGGVGTHQHLVLPQEVPAPVFRGLRKNEDGTVQLQLDVMPGHGVQFEYSLHLTNWFNLAVGTNTGVVLQMTDSAATNSPARFYRARLLD